MVNKERRSFLRWCIYGLGALFGAVLGLPGIAYLVDARHRPAPKRGFRPVQGVRFSDLTAGGPPLEGLIPRQGVIRDLRRDAWTLHPNDVIGRVWVVKLGNDDASIRVFTTICPHLGCFINLDPGGQSFTCPCHGGKFLKDGSLSPAVNPNPPPRGMDTLEWQRAYDPADPDPNNRNLLLVQYQNFVQSEHEKKPKT